MCRFLSAAKATAGRRGQLAVWKPRVPVGSSKKVAADIHIWHVPVELAETAITEATLTVVVNVAVPRNWKVKLSWHNQEVLQWHTRPGRHTNPRDCPASYRRHSNHHEHEHRWQPGCGCRCAKALAGLRTVDLEEFLRRFAERANLDVLQRVTTPIAAEQLRLP